MLLPSQWMSLRKHHKSLVSNDGNVQMYFKATTVIACPLESLKKDPL